MVLYILSQEIIRFGLDTAIIQKKEVSNEEYSAAFFLIASLSIFFAILLYLSSTFISDFYDNQELVLVARMFSLMYIIDGLMHIQKIKLKKSLDFKRLNFYLIISKIIAGSIAIILALKGVGLLSLVYQNIIIAAIQMILICSSVKWMPSRSYQFKNLDELVNYSKYIFSANFIYHISQRLDSLLIAKYFDATLLGLYDRGKNLSELSQRLPSNFIMKPLFTSLSALQDDKAGLHRLMKRIYTSISFVFIPFLLFLVFNAKQLIEFAYGYQWVDAAQYFSLFSIMAIFYLIRVPANYLLLAMGKSKEVFRIEVSISILKIIAIIILAAINLYWMIAALIILRAIEATIYLYFCDNRLSFSTREYLMIIAPYFSIGLILISVINYFFDYLFIIDNSFIYLALSFTSFGCIYLLTNYLLKMDGLSFHWNLTKTYLLKTKSSA